MLDMNDPGMKQALKLTEQAVAAQARESVVRSTMDSLIDALAIVGVLAVILFFAALDWDAAFALVRHFVW